MKQQGFTLIEVLVATFIISAVVIAVSRLLGTADAITGLGRETLVATSSAREGIELVRAMRDSNWFATNEREFWLDHGICRSGVSVYNDANRTFIVDASMVRNSNDVEVGSGQLYINPTNNEWTHIPSGQPTVYSRLISVDCSEQLNDPAKVTVTSKVTWHSRGRDREASIKEVLYNWLPDPSAPNLTGAPDPNL